MMHLLDSIFLLCFFLTTTVASDCPTGCSCRGSTKSEWHTAICYSEKGPDKEFPTTIKTVEIRQLPFSSMRQYLQHASEITDLIIHESHSGPGAAHLQSIPVDLFSGMKHLKALTFQTKKRLGPLHGLAASLHGLDSLRLLDLSHHRLDCSCELPHWIRQNHVILLGVPSLSPSTRCKEAGFGQDVYKAGKLIEMCGEDHTKKSNQPVETSGKDGTNETTTPSIKTTDDSSLKNSEQERKKLGQNGDDDDEEDKKQDENETERGEEGDEEEQQDETDYEEEDNMLEDTTMEEDDEDEDEDDDEDGDEDDDEDDDMSHAPITKAHQRLEDALHGLDTRHLVVPAGSRLMGDKGRSHKPVAPFEWGEPADKVRNQLQPAKADESTGKIDFDSEINFLGDLKAESPNDVTNQYRNLLESLITIGKVYNVSSAGESTTATAATETPPAAATEADGETLPDDVDGRSGKIKYYKTVKPGETESIPPSTGTPPRPQTHTARMEPTDLVQTTEYRVTKTPAPEPKTTAVSQTTKYAPPTTKNQQSDGVSHTGRGRNKSRPSSLQELLLSRVTTDGQDSSIIDSPVDIQLHPVDPYELQLLNKYIQHVSGQRLNKVERKMIPLP